MKILYLIPLLALLPYFPLFSQCDSFPDPGSGEFGCTEALQFPCEQLLSGICGSTSNTGVGPVPAIFCGSVENNVWYSFEASSTQVVIDILVSNCEGTPNGSGLQAQMYETTDCVNFGQISDCVSPGVAGPMTIMNLIPLVPGDIYYLMIDGWAGDFCDFEIQVSSTGSCTFITDLDGNTDGCENQVSSFELISDHDLDGCIFDWTINPPIGEIITGQGTTSSEILWTESGIAELCISSDPDCSTPISECLFITINPIDTTIIELEICPNTTVSCMGIDYAFPGSYLHVLESAGGCDSVVICEITALPDPILEYVGTFTACQADCFEYLGETFCETGFYGVEVNPGACDSVHLFDLFIINAEAIIEAPDFLPCDSTSSPITLDGASSILDVPPATGDFGYNWSGPGILSDPSLPSIEVNVSGLYTLEVYVEYNGILCTSQTEVVVHPSPPSVTNVNVALCEGQTIEIGDVIYDQPGAYEQTLIDTNGCDSLLAIQIVGVPTNSEEMFVTACFDTVVEWQGIEITESGTYEFYESIPGTQCFDTLFLIVDFTVEIILDEVEIISDDGTGNGSIMPILSGGSGYLTYAWDNGETSLNIEDLEAGSYTLEVVDELGCLQLFVFEVSMLVSTVEAGQQKHLVVIPNPVRPNAPVRINPLDQPSSEYQLQIYSVDGREVLDTGFGIHNNGIEFFAPGQAGIYFVKLENGTEVWVTKLLVF